MNGVHRFATVSDFSSVVIIETQLLPFCIFNVYLFNQVKVCMRKYYEMA